MHSQFFLLLLTFVAFGLQLQAQISGVDTYLKGTYMEVGVGECGVYNTGAVAPAGYHPNAGFAPGIGLVCDYQRDGWNIATGSTAFDYCGDYFLPGSPVEGWALTINGTDYINSDAYCPTFMIPGSNVSYATGVTGDTAIWQGAIVGMQVTQTTILPINALYFLTKVKLTNSTTSTMHDVYYGRNVDPDNEQPWMGDFNTTNTIMSQPVPGLTNDAMVVSVGATGECYLGLGTRDPRARVNFGGFGTVTADDLYNGIGRHKDVGDTFFADEGNGLGFFLGEIEAGASVNFAFVYLVDMASMDSALILTETPCVFSYGINQVGSNLTADIVADSYQWVNCDSGMTPIPGGTGASFTATTSGWYACIVTQDSCIDTSACHLVTLVSSADASEQQLFTLSPNPATDHFTITLGNATQAEVTLLNVAGQMVWRRSVTGATFSADLSGLQPGVYFVKVAADGREQTQQLIKQD